MPYVTEVPQGSWAELVLGHQETPSPLNPLGIKGAGEAGVIPVSAVIASAVEDAVGITIDRDAAGPEPAVRIAPGGSCCRVGWNVGRG